MTVLTKLNKKDFEEILLNYDLGSYEAHTAFKTSLGNTIYFITTKTGKYVLKVFEKTKKSKAVFATGDGNQYPVAVFYQIIIMQRFTNLWIYFRTGFRQIPHRVTLY